MSETKLRILVVEDDLSILTGLSMSLRFEGYEVLQAQDGKTGLQKVIDERPDLLVLDVMLPQMNGFEVLEELKRRGNAVPVVVLTAKGVETDRVMGLNLGADDYVVKPFGLQELLARIRAVLRRRTRDEASVRFSDTVVDLNAKTVARAGTPIELTAQEFKLLELFVRNPGHTYSRDELLSGAWGYGYEGTARTVDNFISQLRSKFEPNPEEPQHFRTVRGLGYRFDL
ncbi:MAG: DNA-binding response regulator [Archangium gephyra]|uniref:DNA-binding response regulator n=1 Tax=Archangium gephyra TaxID=48 RepID=A0A2W5V4J9_9BACT|nr:MAG: DNA-binding response regulator [Archangium gephyra]